MTAGSNHTCVLNSTNQAHCFGFNNGGQLGVGASTIESATAVPVTDASNLAALASFDDANFGIRTDGAPVHWGNTSAGHLHRAIPRGFTNATSVATAAFHACAISAETVECWGRNDARQLGRDGPTTDAPMAVPGVPSAIAVSLGEAFSCAITVETELWCWGSNFAGAINFDARGEDQPPQRISVPDDA